MNTESELQRQVASLIWYHSIDLGQGVVTPGIYDHQPYLEKYGIPADLQGRTALDVGAASGFFSFELERRGAQVTATELPTWMAHDFGPRYAPDLDPAQAHTYLHDPFLFAQRALGSRVSRRLTDVYTINAADFGTFDLVFCGSVLLHLTDPIRALWRLQSVTRGLAIICTTIDPHGPPDPVARFTGHERGDTWWLPNRAALEGMVASAGFAGWAWHSDFRLDYRDGTEGPHHAVIHAWNTPERPAL